MIDHSKIDQYHSFAGIPAMTSPQVHQYLEELGRQWKGEGAAIELGCWLGASSVALLKGLTAVGYDKPFWAFDGWVATKDQIPKAKAQGVKLTLGQDVLPMFRENVCKFYDNVKTVKGGMPSTLHFYDSQRIEICIFDAPKSEPVFSEAIKILSPFWVSGVTILGLLDYDFYLRHKGEKREKFRAPVIFMNNYKSHFSLIKDWDDEAVKFFKYEKIF